MPSEWKLNYVHCGGLPIHFECICSGAVTAADQNSTWFLALGVAELPHDEDLDDDDHDDHADHDHDHVRDDQNDDPDDDHDHGAELPQVKDLDDDDIITMLVIVIFSEEILSGLLNTRGHLSSATKT